MQNYGVIPPELQSRGSPNSELITLAAQRMSDRKDGNGFNRGTVVSVRGSVIDAQFPQGLPQLYSQLQAGEDGEVAIIVWV